MRVLLGGGHGLYREGLRVLLEDLGPPLAVVEAGDCADAARLLAGDGDFDLAVVDVDLACAGAVEGLARLVQAAPTVPFVALSAAVDRRDIQRALAMGIVGIILKSERAGVILRALRAVLDGEIYMPERLDGVPAAEGD